jgi:hypothetical protein
LIDTRENQGVEQGGNFTHPAATLPYTEAIQFLCRLRWFGTKAAQLYGSFVVNERHRHRFEFNNHYREKFEKAGFAFSGLSPDGKLVEVIELKDHPFFVASQFHPEYCEQAAPAASALQRLHRRGAPAESTTSRSSLLMAEN